MSWWSRKHKGSVTGEDAYGTVVFAGTTEHLGACQSCWVKPTFSSRAATYEPMSFTRVETQLLMAPFWSYTPKHLFLPLKRAMGSTSPSIRSSSLPRCLHTVPPLPTNRVSRESLWGVLSTIHSSSAFLHSCSATTLICTLLQEGCRSAFEVPSVPPRECATCGPLPA